MRDFTSGALVYVTLRPDYSAEKHRAVQQSGYMLDLTPVAVADEHNYEEIKDQTTSTIGESQASSITAQATEMPVSHSQTEDDLDAQFFKGNLDKLKLNKGEKRALKFCIKKGVDLSAISDIKGFLQTQMQGSKQTKNTPISAGANAQGQNTGKKKNNNHHNIKASNYMDLQNADSD